MLCVYCAFYIVHYTMFKYCIQYITVHYIMRSVQCTMYVHYTVYTHHVQRYTFWIQCLQCILYNEQCSYATFVFHIIQVLVLYIHVRIMCMSYTVHCSLYSVQVVRYVLNVYNIAHAYVIALLSPTLHVKQCADL